MEIPIELQKIIDPDKECCCVYHFSNKCKEWALLNGYCLASAIHDNGNYESKYCVCEIMKPVYGSSCLYYPREKTTDADTEPEAIFKACQWVLDNKDK
jgi:hypothetical protein